MPLEGPEPKPGDLIEFKHRYFQHWAVYVGGGKVVHLTDQCGWPRLSSAVGGIAVVKEDSLEIAAAGCIYRVNNKYDRKREPYPSEIIVYAARREVGKVKNYSVTSANCEHFVTELRYDDSFCDQGPKPKPGDLIEFIRTLYQHWGVYVGRGKVVHLTDPNGQSSISLAFGGIAVVKEESLEFVAAGCTYRVNNKYDNKTEPYPPEIIVNAAWREVGQIKNYSVTSANCEHFVTELRYGDCYSDQIIKNLMPIAGAITVAAAQGVKIMGSTVSSNSEIVGSIATKGVNLAGQGLTAMSVPVGTAAGKVVAAIGNMLSIGTQSLAPVIAARADAISAGSGTMVLNAANCITPLAESLAAQSGGAEEATARGIVRLGSFVSSSSGIVGSAVATGLSWLGSASAAGASSLIGYLKSDAQSTNQTDGKINIHEVGIKRYL